MPTRQAWQLVPDSKGTRLVLPPRDLPRIKLIGVGVVLLGLIFEVIFLSMTAAFWWPVLRAVLTGTATIEPRVLLLAVPLLAVLFMIIPIGIGAVIGFGHTELLLTSTHARSIERCGPFRHQQSVAYKDIRRIVIDHIPADSKDKAVTAGSWSNYGRLEVKRIQDDEDQPGVTLVSGYPKAVTAALGDELKRHMGRNAEATVDITVRDEIGKEVYTEPLPQPAASTAVLQHTPEGISITLPPLGFFLGSKGLGQFSIIWLGFVCLFSLVVVGMSKSAGPPSQVPLMFVLAIIFFGANGVVMFCIALRSGRRRAVIDVVGTDLLIAERSIGLARSRCWNRDQIECVVVGRSGVERDKVPILQMQVWLLDDNKIRLFHEREDDELRWMVSEIHQALRMNERA